MPRTSKPFLGSGSSGLGTGGLPSSIVAGDFTGDGKVDLATFDTSQVGVFLGNGNGTFQARTSLVPYGPSPVRFWQNIIPGRK